MKRDFTQGEMGAIQLVLGTIDCLDNLVFPEKPIKHRIIYKEETGVDGERFSYTSRENAALSGDPEHYAVWGYGLDRFLEERGREERVVLAEKIGELDYLEMPPLSVKGYVIGVAAHEIRHRVQARLPIRLISPKDVERSEDTRLRSFISFADRFFKLKPPKRNFCKEFDAKVVEFLVKEEYHFSRDLRKVAELIRFNLSSKTE